MTTGYGTPGMEIGDGRVPSEPGSREPSPSVSAASGFDPSRDRLQVLLDAEKAEGGHLLGIIPAGHKCGPITVDSATWEAGERAHDAVRQARAALAPTEQDAIRLMWEGFLRLKELGWNEAIYCPKDGSEFDAIEAGSTGIHRCHYSGEWPDGHWWIADAGDLWPSRPILYRPTEAELAGREELRERFRTLRDSDRSGEAGETGTGSTVGESAGRDSGIARTSEVNND